MAWKALSVDQILFWQGGWSEDQAQRNHTHEYVPERTMTAEHAGIFQGAARQGRSASCELELTLLKALKKVFKRPLKGILKTF